jgi:CHAT domain-containing protein
MAKKMFIASILLRGRITANAAEQPAPELRQREHEVVTSFRAGDLTAALAVRAKPVYRHPFYWSPFVAVGTNR